MAPPMQSQIPQRRTTVSSPAIEARSPSPLALVAVAFGAAGFAFGAYFYIVPFQRKSAQVERLTRELAARPSARTGKVDLQSQDAAAREQSEMKVLQEQIGRELASVSPTITIGAHRMRVRLGDDLFDARGPYLTKTGQEAIQALGQLLGARAHRVVIAAPMGGANVPRWIRGQLPTPADLSGARAGNALKAAVKGGVRAEVVLAVIGTLAVEEPDAAPTLDFEIEP